MQESQRSMVQCNSYIIAIIIVHWLISDLIPKKSEKFEFWKNFVTMFFSVKNWPIKQNFEIFRPRNFEKIVKKNPKLQSGQSTRNFENFRQIFFFHCNQRKIVIACSPPKKVFDPWIKSYEAYSIFRTSVVLEYVTFKFVTYIHISNQNFMADSVKSKFFESAHANFFKRDFL